MSTQGLLFQSASNMQNLIQRVGLVQSGHHHDILYVAGIHNTMIKLTIYFNSLMHIDAQITNIIPL
jgi:hypothetical protein